MKADNVMEKANVMVRFLQIDDVDWTFIKFFLIETVCDC